jgi:hypothetical protein
MLDVGALQVIILNEMEDAVTVEDNARVEPTTMLSTEASLVPAADFPATGLFAPSPPPGGVMTYLGTPH